MDCNFTDKMLKKQLCKYISVENWDKIVELHIESDQRAFKISIDSYTGDTAFLQAISNAREEIVKRLVGLLTRDESRVSEAKEIMNFTNEKRRTPLHAAAATGNAQICKIIAIIDESVVFARDYKGETPVFRAVRYGRAEAFYYLNSLAIVHRDQTFGSIKYCWNDDDQTILHNAIIRENFDLAFQIIHMYKEFVNLVDKEGDSPLHILARKPSAFKSGSRLGRLDRKIYNRLSVDKLKKKGEENSDPEQELKEKKNPSKIRILNFVLGGSHHGNKEVENVDIESREGCMNQKGSNTISDQECRSLWRTKFNMLTNKIRDYFSEGDIRKTREEKKKHVWAAQVLDELLKEATLCDGEKPLTPSGKADEEKKSAEKIPVEDSSKCPEKETKKETSILIAAKYGISEIIEKTLTCFPTAINDKDQYGKNIVLIALENRNLEVLNFLRKKYRKDHIVFQKVDDKGNTALHYAAMYDEERARPWPVPGAALQMQREIKWHEYVENVMPKCLYLRTNKEGQTAKELFSQTHKGLVKKGSEWLTSTATSCSVVAALIAGVAFASSTSTPGGSVKNNATFELFAISSLVSLCFSVTSLVMFLAILTSRQVENDFSKDLPRKILFGLTSLFVSIASVLVTFCAGHFLVFKDNLKYAVFPVYAVTFLPLCLFAAAQFPLYYDLLRAPTF